MTIGRTEKTNGASVHPSYKGLGKIHGIGCKFVRNKYSDNVSKKVVTKGAFGNKSKFQKRLDK